LLTASYVTLNQHAIVVASMTDTVQHVTLIDTCYVHVTATTPALPLATFTIQPGAGGDTLMPLDKTYTMTTTASDDNGQPVASFSYFWSSNPNIASINSLTGAMRAAQMGAITVYASTWAYGVVKRDSLRLTVGVPVSAKIQVLPVAPTGSTRPTLTFWPQIITVAAGAVVTWMNPSLTDSIDVVFDDTTNVDSAKFGNNLLKFATGEGNIAPWVLDTAGTDPISAMICTRYGGVPPHCNNFAVRQFAQQRLRKFPVPGTYHYHSTKWKASGTIVVQ
jgi:hypothetical protein